MDVCGWCITVFPSPRGKREDRDAAFVTRNWHQSACLDERGGGWLRVLNHGEFESEWISWAEWLVMKGRCRGDHSLVTVSIWMSLCQLISSRKVFAREWVYLVVVGKISVAACVIVTPPVECVTVYTRHDQVADRLHEISQSTMRDHDENSRPHVWQQKHHSNIAQPIGWDLPKMTPSRVLHVQNTQKMRLCGYYFDRWSYSEMEMVHMLPHACNKEECEIFTREPLR